MRRRVRRGLMAAYISSQRETRGSTDLCSLMAAAAPKRTARSCVRERSGWVLGKGSSPESDGHGRGCPGLWAQPQADGLQGAFGQCSQIQGLDFGWPCVEPRVGCDDPCGSLPTQNILQFYDVSFPSTVACLLSED